MAQTVGPVNGTLAVISVGGTVVSHITSNGLSFEMSTRDTSSKDSGGDKESLEGQRSFGGDVSGWMADDATFGFHDLYDLFVLRAAVAVLWTTTVAGDTEYSGQAFITSLTKTSGNEETVTFDATLEGTGAVTKAVIV